MGDLILSLPVATAIKRTWPRCRVDFMVSAANAPLLAYHADTDSALAATDADGRMLSSGELTAAMRAGDHDAAVLLRPAWSTAWAAFRARVPLRVGTRRRGYAFLYNRRVDNPRKYSGRHETDLNVQMLAPLGITLPGEPLAPVLRARGRLTDWPVEAPDPARPFAVIHPGSRGSAPNWPQARYLELARALARRMPVVITGNLSLPAGGAGVIDLTRRTTLSQLVELLSRAVVFVAGSTGPLHLAAALGTRTIGLYPAHAYLGPERWGPRGPRAEALTPPRDAAHHCARGADGSCACMDKIEVARVLAAVG
jgi:ADP-heptose:LPS heptosyltransferase